MFAARLVEEPAAFAGGAKGVRIQPGLAASVKGAPARTLDPIVQESARLWEASA